MEMTYKLLAVTDDQEINLPDFPNKLQLEAFVRETMKLADLIDWKKKMQLKNSSKVFLFHAMNFTTLVSEALAREKGPNQKVNPIPAIALSNHLFLMNYSFFLRYAFQEIEKLRSRNEDLQKTVDNLKAAIAVLDSNDDSKKDRA